MKLSPTIIELLDSLGRSTETLENLSLLQAIDEAIDQAINDEVAAMAKPSSSSVMSDEAFLELIPVSTYFH